MAPHPLSLPRRSVAKAGGRGHGLRHTHALTLHHFRRKEQAVALRAKGSPCGDPGPACGLGCSRTPNAATHRPDITAPLRILAMPAHRPEDPGNIPSAPSLELRERTPHVAPREAAASRHRQPCRRDRAPFPWRKPGVLSAAVGIPPPFRPTHHPCAGALRLSWPTAPNQAFTPKPRSFGQTSRNRLARIAQNGLEADAEGRSIPDNRPVCVLLSTVLAEVYRALPLRTCVRRGGFEGR